MKMDSSEIRFEMKNRRKELRENQTDAERVLWFQLRKNYLGGLKFRRQHQLGRYIVDFVCLDKRLIIELDGGQHAERQTYDDARTAWLNAQGYKVLRFWNNDVIGATDLVTEKIMREVGLLK